MAARIPWPVRPGEPEDLPFLWEMLYEAAHHRPLSDLSISRYLDGWGRPGDAAVVALDPDGGRKVGAAWYRLMPAGNPGYGFVDVSTPELAIAVVPDRRGIGVGRALLRALLGTARSRDLKALSLSVLRDNLAAVRLYEENDFVRLSDLDSEFPSWVMRAGLSTVEAWPGAVQTNDAQT